MNETLEEELKALEGRLKGVRETSDGKELFTAILVRRHDYFGYELCKAMDIPYRNDVKLVDILHECFHDIDTGDVIIPNITPDNFIFDGEVLTILDYKVSVSLESTEHTIEKYTKELDKIRNFLPSRVELCIIRCHPRTTKLTFTNDRIKRLYANIQLELNFEPFENLITELKDRFRDSDEFLAMIAHGDVTLTVKWCQTGCPELRQHPIFNEFYESLEDKYKEMFDRSMQFSAYSAEKWNQNLIKIRDQTSDEYKEFVRRNSSELFQTDGNYPEPSKEEILAGWDEMSERIQQTRQMSKDINDQKPSIHFIWSEHNPKLPTHSTHKLMMVSKLLQNLSSNSDFADDFRQIGKLMDIGDNVLVYENHCEALKLEARKNLKPIQNRKLNPRRIGSAQVLWEQQFLMSAEDMGKARKVHLLKEYFGIGRHRDFSHKTNSDINMEKPKILDFNDPDIIRMSQIMMEKTSGLLSQQTTLKPNHAIVDEYMDNIKEANENTFKTIKQILSTKYWSCISDISMLMKNILSVAQYNRSHTFRLAMCANNSLYALVLPSADIKSRKSTVVFCIIALHTEEESVFNPGCLHATYKTFTSDKTGWLSISKAIRLDKERCQRIVTSPGLFLSTVTLLKQDNNSIDLNDVMNFALYTSLNVTKSMLSLTEPSRYMIMNSLAVSSHVKEYISGKFNPYTKTLFSVYMCNKIKIGCLNAFNQRQKIKLRDIFLTDFDITQKGISDNRDLTSIWFPGFVTLKEYLNQIFLVFYLNPKGLHEKHHVMIDLLKTVIEIELDQRNNIPVPWSDTPKKQTVNLPIFLNSVAINLMHDTAYCTHLRSRIENRNNLRRSFSTISTFTSSKSCIKIGDFSSLKTEINRKIEKARKAEEKRSRIANPDFIHDEEYKNVVELCNYDMMRKAIPEYTDHISTKVFDRLYELQKNGTLTDEPVVGLILEMMVNHKQFFFSFFNKGQKTAKDREIFVGEYEAKMCMYLVERIFKERSKVNPDEMISEPGDGKLKVLERKAEQEIRFLIEHIKQRNSPIMEEIENLKESVLFDKSKLEDLVNSKYHGLKLEINADMSKWSAQDVFFKYFWVVAMDPILYPEEKERIIFFFCNYMNKRLIIPDEVIYTILDQQIPYKNDMVMQVTNGLHSNTFNVKRNWLQGNFNYMSSYVHSCAMSVYKDILRTAAKKIEADIMVNSMVHSDDNQTAICLINNRLDTRVFTKFAIQLFEKICLTFGCQANMKKTYVTNHIKEFVSLFNLYGEPFSIYGRFTLTAVGDCAYIGPYEDLASRISSTQTAIKHGCPASLAWLSISISHWITYLTYNMLPGQINDPSVSLGIENRREIPIELGGYLEANLSMIALAGLESGNIQFLINLLTKMVNPILFRENVVSQCSDIKNWDLTRLTFSEIFRLKVLRFLALDAEMDCSDTMGETGEMRSRSLLTPRKFTTAGSLRKLVSFGDFQACQSEPEGINTVVEYMIEHPELLVTKGETAEDYKNIVLYRYNSRRFKESLSIQNPAQLFLEQILFSHKPIIDYTGIQEKYLNLSDSTVTEDQPEILGRVTFPEAFRKIREDLSTLKITINDIQTVYDFVILNDPMVIAIANAHLLSNQGAMQDRLGSSCSTMPEFRNFRLITHSPALVLRSYSTGRYDVPGADPDEMRRDRTHLQEFIDNTKLLLKMEQRIEQNEKAKGSRDILFEIKEITKFYQVCYEYIKSTEHKVKVYILPVKCYTTTDFCAAIQGSLIKDKQWAVIQHIHPVSAGGHKGIVQKHTTNEIKLAEDCMRLIAFFIDTFIDENHRIYMFKRMVDEFTYSGRKVSDLLEIIATSKNRVDFLPILYRSGLLEQRDLDSYDALKSSGRPTWNKWQTTRALDMGKIDLSIDTHRSSIRIIGEDRNLHYAELYLPSINYDSITRSGYKLLNAKHGLKFQSMSEVSVRKDEWYITYQRKSRDNYVYKIFYGKKLLNPLPDHDLRYNRTTNPIVPVCHVIPMVRPDIDRIMLEDMDSLNIENFKIGVLNTGIGEQARLRRCMLHKMKNFEGPDIKSKVINLTKLMKDNTLMSLNYDNVCNVHLSQFCKLLDCNGNEGTLDDAMYSFSDEPMEQTQIDEIECTPIFKVQYSVPGSRYLNYRNAIKELLSREIRQFREAFTLVGDDFDSPENIGYLENIICIIDQLQTNEWSTIMKKCIHICFLASNQDHVFHTFSLNKYFFEGNTPASGRLNWRNLKSFIISLPEIKSAPWRNIFSSFKLKCIALLDREIAKVEVNQDFSKILAREDLRQSFFNFF
uniref:RNA-directed RNA polymerase L n=1 Tax=Gamboa virus TaxID=35313 RepID=A0A2K8HZ72_9VIRU|nr:RNA-dependent RNA polymerase [Gamboa virus]